MPLLWTHAEYLKLLVARDCGKPVELLQAVEDRYAAKPPAADTWHWRAEAAFAQLARGRSLAIEHRGPFVLRYGFDGWQATSTSEQPRRGPFGFWSVTFRPESSRGTPDIDFTRRFDAPGRKSITRSRWGMPTSCTP